MKSLKEYMTEGLLDRVKNKEVVHSAVVKEFLEANYKFYRSYSIKEINNKLVVDVKGDIWVKNKDITLLTNRLFEFSTVSGNFKCDGCKSLRTLEGAPKEVGGDFNCSHCKSLTTLEGVPKEVGRDFNCSK